MRGLCDGAELAPLNVSGNHEVVRRGDCEEYHRERDARRRSRSRDGLRGAAGPERDRQARGGGGSTAGYFDGRPKHMGPKPNGVGDPNTPRRYIPPMEQQSGNLCGYECVRQISRTGGGQGPLPTPPPGERMSLQEIAEMINGFPHLRATAVNWIRLQALVIDGSPCTHSGDDIGSGRPKPMGYQGLYCTSTEVGAQRSLVTDL